MRLMRALFTNSTQNGYATFPVCLLQTAGGVPDGSTDAPVVLAAGTGSFNSTGVLRVPGEGRMSHDLELIPFGAGAATNTCAVRVVGWRRVGATWVPNLLCDLAVTLGAAVGLAASSDIKSTDLFAKTITATTGLVVLPSCTTDTPARAVVNVHGYDYVQIQTSTAGSATNVNALVQFRVAGWSEHKVS